MKRGRRAIWALGDQMLVLEVASRMWGKRTETLELLQKRIEERCRKGECQKTKGKR